MGTGTAAEEPWKGTVIAEVSAAERMNQTERGQRCFEVTMS